MTSPDPASNLPDGSEKPDDRLRIAQRLHDGPCQTFSSAQLLAQILLREAEGDTAVELHRELAAMLAAGVHELQEILSELRDA